MAEAGTGVPLIDEVAEQLVKGGHAAIDSHRKHPGGKLQLTNFTAYSWNIFRYVGDYLHLAGIIVLMGTILKNKSVAGISRSTQILYFLVFITRYLDLFDHSQTTYLVFFKMTYICTSIAVLALFHKFAQTYERRHDTCNLAVIIIPCATAALLLTDEYSALEVLWTFSEFVEGFAMVPQYIFCYRECQGKDWGTTLYVLFPDKGFGFITGQEITLLSNYKCFIYDADDFICQFFREDMGSELGACMDVRMPDRTVPRPPTPPYTGYGSWDDSLSSVTHLIPKPPRKDVKKLFQHEGKVLRFMARFANPKAEDTERVFVLSYHLADDGFSIHEPPQRNLGIVTGKFLEKGMHMNEMNGKLITPEDLLPGNLVKVHSHEFEVVDMDEYTKKLFTDPNAQFKQYDLEAVLQKLRESMRQQDALARDIFRRFDKDRDGVITVGEFAKALEKFGFSNLPEETVMHLLRHFNPRQDGQVSYNEFCDTLLDEDFPTRMLHTKAPIALDYDHGYAEKAKFKVQVRQETKSVRNAVQQIGSILLKRENMMMKIIKEFKHLTHEDTASLAHVQQALSQTGHPMNAEDVERAVLHIMPDADLNAIPYVKFFQGVKTSFHDVSANR